MTADTPSDPDFAARRAAAREALSAIDPFLNGERQPDPFRKDWFTRFTAWPETTRRKCRGPICSRIR
jgi:hypothetical protein